MSQSTENRPPRPPAPRRRKPGEGTIFSVWKNGRWAWKGELPLRKGVKTCTADTYAGCEAKLDALILQYGSLSNILAKDTLYRCAMEWRKLQEDDGTDTNTLESYRYHIEVSIGTGAPGEKLGRTKITDLTVADFNDLWRKLARQGGKKGNGIGFSYLIHIRSTLGKILRRAEQQGKLRQNVVTLSETIESLRDKGIVRSPRATRAPNEKQFGTILEAAAKADPQIEQFLQVGADVGPRAGELAGARWENIDWGERTILFNVTVKRKTGYTYTDGTQKSEEILTDATLKTDDSERRMALTDDAIAALRRREEDQDEEREQAGDAWEEHGLIFTDRTGGPLSLGWISERITRITEPLGLGRWSITEICRRNFATRIATAKDADGKAAVPAEDLALLMGHKHGNPRTVRQYYIDHTQQPTRSAHLNILNKKKGQQ